MPEESEKTFIGGLWDRKVPQFLGTYFAVGFGLLQFVEFITNRYNLGGNLVDKYLLVWLSLIPAIAILIYFGKRLYRSETSKSLRWPKILIIGNVVGAFLLGGFLFNNEAHGQGQVVELTDEQGKKVKAVVPTLNKVKTVAVFQFENLTGSEKEDWWGVAFSHLLQLNLNQRPEFYTYAAYSLNGYHDALGLESFQVPNVGMQREIAQKSRNDYFTRISYDLKNNLFVFDINLYDTKNGKNLLDISLTEENPYTAVDKIKEQIFANIPDMIKGIKNETKLPASGLITNNQEALKKLTQSRIAYYKNPTGLERVVKLAKEAVQLDPTCAQCHFWVGDPLYGLGRREESIKYIKNAIKYGASLPERMQFRLKGTLYAITNNIDAYLKLLELQRKMYPYEFQPYQQLLTIYKTNYGIDSAKVLMRESIKNGNLEKGLLALYNLQLENEEYDEAKKTLDRFTSEFPDRKQDRVKYASLFENQGKLKEAKTILLEEETIDPLNTRIQTRLAYLDYKNLDFEKADERLDRGFEQASTLTDSLNFLWIKAYFLRTSGQINNAFRILEKYEKHAIKRTPINRLILTTFVTKADMYQSVGQTEKVALLLNQIRKYSPESVAMYDCTANTNAIQRGYQTSLDKKEYNACQESYKSYGEGFTDFFNVMTAYHIGDLKTCLEILDQDQGKIRKLFKSNEYFLVKLYIESGKKERAKELLKKIIDQKTDEPIFYYQMALLLEKEDPKASKDYLDIALKFWANADLEYIPYQRAKELEKRLVFKA